MLDRQDSFVSCHNRSMLGDGVAIPKPWKLALLLLPDMAVNMSVLNGAVSAYYCS